MQLTLPLLSMLIWIPIMSGVCLLFFRFNNIEKVFKCLSMFIVFVCFSICVFLVLNFDKQFMQMQFIEHIYWLPMLGINYILGIDGFSLLLILLVSFIMLFVVGFAIKTVSFHVIEYLALLLIIEGLVCGVFVSLDAVLFYIFFETVLVAMFLLTGIWGGKNRTYASIKFLIFMLFGSIFLLIALIYLGTMAHSFVIYELQNLLLTSQEQRWLFLFFVLAFGIKLPIWPLHTWLPDVHAEAPIGGSVIFAAIILKLGAYGLLRFLMPIVPNACMEFAWYIVMLSSIGIIYISFITVSQLDLKRLIAYSSISHMNLIIFGLFVVFIIVQKDVSSYEHIVLGIEGSLMQMISHSLIVSALFLCAGILYNRRHSRIIAEFGGIATTMPIFAVFFMLFCMANLGLPGTSGFVGKFFIILAAFKADFWYAFIIGSMFVLSAIYTLWMYHRIVYGEITLHNVRLLKDLNNIEIFVLMMFAISILIVGLWPNFALDFIHTSTMQLVNQIGKC